jgi:exodeoxyribonuclease VIII
MRYFTDKTLPSAAMNFGSLVHCLVLEPETFADNYAVPPENINRRTKEGKTQWDEFLATNADKTILNESDYQQALKAVDGLKTCKTAVDLLRSCKQVEQQIEFTYRGQTIRGVIDGQCPDFVLDLKTTQDASPRNFKWSVRKFLYNMQAAIYTHENGLPYYIIALEKNGACAVYEMHENLIQEGRALFDQLITKYLRCSFEESWNDGYGFGQPDGVFLLD